VKLTVYIDRSRVIIIIEIEKHHIGNFTFISLEFPRLG